MRTPWIRSGAYSGPASSIGRCSLFARRNRRAASTPAPFGFELALRFLFPALPFAPAFPSATRSSFFRSFFTSLTGASPSSSSRSACRRAAISRRTSSRARSDIPAGAPLSSSKVKLDVELADGTELARQRAHFPVEFLDLRRGRRRPRRSAAPREYGATPHASCADLACGRRRNSGHTALSSFSRLRQSLSREL